MKHLSEYKDEEALDMLADLIDPVINIFGDKEVADFYRGGVLIKAVQVSIRKHKEDVITMLAILERVPREEYHCNLLTLPKVLLNVFSDPELKDFFSEQSEGMTSEGASGSAMESTKEEADTSSNI